MMESNWSNIIGEKKRGKERKRELKRRKEKRGEERKSYCKMMMRKYTGGYSQLEIN